MSLNPEYQNLQINLRSDDPAIQGSLESDTDLKFQFNRTITIPEQYHLNVSVSTAEIPHSWYTFDEEIKMQVMFDPPGSNTLYYVVTIPVRNWTPCCFQKYFLEQSILLSNDPHYPLLTFSTSTLKWTLDQSTGDRVNNPILFYKTISDPPGPEATYTTLSPATCKGLFKFFGLPEVLAPPGTIPAIDYGVQPNIADSLRFHTISITSNFFHTSSIDSNSAEIGDQHVLAKVPTNAPFGSMILFKGNLQDGYLLKLQKLNTVDLALRDHNGDLINLNGGRFNVSLLAQFIKRTDYTAVPNSLPPVINYNSFVKRLAKRRRRRLA
jgi:hypothetical protein